MINIQQQISQTLQEQIAKILSPNEEQKEMEKSKEMQCEEDKPLLNVGAAVFIPSYTKPLVTKTPLDTIEEAEQEEEEIDDFEPDQLYKADHHQQQQQQQQQRDVMNMQSDMDDMKKMKRKNKRNKKKRLRCTDNVERLFQSGMIYKDIASIARASFHGWRLHRCHRTQSTLER